MFILSGLWHFPKENALNGANSASIVKFLLILPIKKKRWIVWTLSD